MTPQSIQSVSAATPQGVGNYYLPYNQFDSMSSPISRRTNVTSQAPALPKKEPLTTKSPVFMPHFTHFMRNSHALELARMRYAIQMFAFMCAFSAFFVFLGLNRIDKLKLEMPSMANKTLFGLNGDMIIWESSISICIVTVLTSICVFFVSGSQLFFLLKVLKADPKAFTQLLRYIKSTRLLRIITYGLWAICIIAFIAVCIASVISIPGNLCLYAKGFAISVGVGAFILCSIAFFHAIFSWCQLDFTTTQTDVDPVTGEYKSLSTLV
ncbi:hypothetical protein QR680_010750 [Steinernema hermaphroditum]|uniref:Uncharacterized protein n=1 Tax=Steinernema hermaphroditum TaxID=289476 RepID=A0AA39MCB3_9BILA|nr:hypothetical protein QR680_010750 [Steinernema hermaphroditum]